MQYTTNHCRMWSLPLHLTTDVAKAEFHVLTVDEGCTPSPTIASNALRASISSEVQIKLSCCMHTIL